MKSTALREIFELPPGERIRLAKDLLESVTDDGPELSERDKAILDERLAEEAAHPNDTVTWKEIKAGLKAKGKNKR